MWKRDDSTTLLLILSGDTPWTREGRLRGRTDLPLTNGGRAAAVADSTRLNNSGGDIPAIIYHSNDESARDTAGIFAATLGVKIKAAPGLSEPDLGLLEGLNLHELSERHPRRHKQWLEDPLALIPPEGEPMIDARARIFRGLARIMRKSRGGIVAAVTHPVANGLIRSWLTGRTLAELWRLLEERPRVEPFVIDETMREELERGGIRETEKSE